jgi:tetratricopeptide (TPR) repeat protein
MDANAVEAAEAALEKLPSSGPSRGEALNELGKALQKRFQETNSTAYLSRAITVYDKAVEMSSVGPANQARYLNNLSVALQIRFRRTTQENDLDEAIRHGRRAAEKASDQHRPAIEMNLGNSLQEKFACSGDVENINESISIYKNALLLPGAQTVRPKLQSNLCAALSRRFSIDGVSSDLDDSCKAGQEAVDLTNNQHPMRAIFLDTSSNALYTRYQLTDSGSDLKTAITQGEEAVSLASSQGLPQLLDFCVNLGGCLAASFRLTENIHDLLRAIQMFEFSEAKIPKDGPGYQKCLFNKGVALRMRFEETASPKYLSASIEALDSAVKLKVFDKYTRAESESALGVSLLRKYELEGSEDAIDSSIHNFETALERIPPTIPYAADVRNDLSFALEARFELRGSTEDLDQALRIVEKDLKSTIKGSAAYGTSHLAMGNVLVRRFERIGASDDLDRAVKAYESAVDSKAKSERPRAAQFACLAHALQTRYSLTKSDSDWNRSVQLCKDALKTSRKDQNKHVYLTTLGNAFLRRYVQGEAVSKREDLTNAINNFEDAHSAMPEHHSIRAMCLNNLGKAYDFRFHLLRDPNDSTKAVEVYETAMNLTSAAPMLRVTAGFRGSIFTGEENLEKAVYFIRETAKLLPAISPRMLNRSDQQQNIATFSGLASFGAAILLQAEGDALKTVELLELSRGLMNNLLLETRTGLSTLAQSHSDVIDRFNTLRDQLDSPPVALSRAPFSRKGPNLESGRRIALAKEFAQLVERVRPFLFDTSERKLQSLAEFGPLVYLNVSRFRCDALILTAERIWHLPLPKLLQDDVLKNAQKLMGDLTEYTPDRRIQMNDTVRDILPWLWDSAVEPVLTELGMRVSEDEDHLPRIWWIPVGLMSVFPIHAAGKDMAQPHENALDCVRSSYTPTIKTLDYSRKRFSQRPGSSSNHLFVAMQETPGQNPLRVANEEVGIIASLTPGSKQEEVLKEKPTKSQVRPLLETCSIALFSCHGEVDLDDPSASCLLLQDWQSDPFTVADIAALKLENARLAYLSACHTAYNRVLTLLDEGIHLAGAFQISGFPHTIGTLWQVDDKRSLEISRQVWESMLTDTGHLDCSKAPDGLHKAVRKLREKTKWIEEEGITLPFDDEPFVWAPFIHMGC